MHPNLSDAGTECGTLPEKEGLVLPEDELRDTIRLFQDMDNVLRCHARAEVIKPWRMQTSRYTFMGRDGNFWTVSRKIL